MHHSKSLVHSSSETVSLSDPGAATPGPEERLSQTIKSLFTLADVAARRRASRNVKKLVKIDENPCYAQDATGSSPWVSLRRTKSSGDVAVLGENSRALNAGPDAGHAKKYVSVIKDGKCNRGRSATTSSVTPSKIPKAKSPTSLCALNSCPPPVDEDDWKSPAMISDASESEGFNVVDDALFVMLTPQAPVKTNKNLTLAAHIPSLPKVASPFSPRTNQHLPQAQTRPSSRSTPATGHTNASLHLTKSHWELRYESWIRSLRTHRRRPRSARSLARPSSVVEEPRSRFPEPPTNPALFPRAGMLTPKALRHYSLSSDEESRSALELDWALRGWPMDKIQRTLFAHDMDVRVWFPVAPSTAQKEAIEDPTGIDRDTRNVTPGPDNDEWEERTLRRWEWDWELRWRVVEGIVEDETDKDRTECEYDVFLAENHHGDEAYAGCEVEVEGRVQTKEDGWEWEEDAMEIDSVL